tara:strand:- start:313 stop:909 length:597 start_codon:yes stop_codon:yes gene_type:complete
MSFVAIATIGAGALGAYGSKKAGQGQAAAGKYATDLQRDQMMMGSEAGRSGQQRADSSLNRFMGDFNQSTTGTPEAVTRLQQLIREQALPEQQRAMNLGNIQRQQQGVRGIDAAVLGQQQSNQMNQQLARQAEGIGLRQALQDRQARQQQAANLAQRSLGGSIAGTSNYTPPATKQTASKPAMKTKDYLKKFTLGKFF